VSFGGMVALATPRGIRPIPPSWCSSAPQPPEASIWNGAWRCSKRFGGPETGALARRRFLEVRGHDEASLEAWRRLASPHYTRTPRDPDWARRLVGRPEVLHWFTKPGGESQTFDCSRICTASAARRS